MVGNSVDPWDKILVPDARASIAQHLLGNPDVGITESSMEEALRKFLQNHETEEPVWFQIPAGIVYGELQKLKSHKSKTIMLKRAFLYAGGIPGLPIEVETAKIRVSEISAWGDDNEV